MSLIKITELNRYNLNESKKYPPWTDLAAAIADGDMHSIIQAFAEGARPESIIDHKTRKTCLHLSVDYPKLHVVEFLLQNAPDAQNDQADYPGPVDVDGNTILHR